MAQGPNVFTVEDLRTTLHARGLDAVGGVSPLRRAVRLVETQLRAADEQRAGDAVRQARRRRPLIQLADDESAILVSGERAHTDLAVQVLAQLRKEPQPELRLQCTLVRVPEEVAARHGLVAGQVRSVDEAAAGKLLKDATKAQGGLQNLPEATVSPLLPFRLRHVGEANSSSPTSPLRVRGEALMVGDEEALFAVQLVAGDLPKDPTELPKSPLLDVAFRLQAGAGVMMLAGSGPDDAGNVLAVWLRFVDVVAKEPAPKAEVEPGR